MIFKIKIIRFGLQILKFLAAGLPAFAVAIPLNIFLVEKCQIPKPGAYAIVMLTQITVNFFICRKYVFIPSPDKTIIRQFVEFTGAIAAFRLADWFIYSSIVNFANINYIIVQCANGVIFSFAKFFFSKKAIEGKTSI